MVQDQRFCSICQMPLLKQDRFGYVLIRRCDQCTSIVHERCFLKHNIEKHDLIAIVIEESEENARSIIYRDDKDIIEFRLE